MTWRFLRKKEHELETWKEMQKMQNKDKCWEYQTNDKQRQSRPEGDQGLTTKTWNGYNFLLSEYRYKIQEISHVIPHH